MELFKKCGHPKTPENIYFLQEKYTYCRICHRARSIKAYANLSPTQYELRKNYLKQYRKANYSALKIRVAEIRNLLLAKRDKCVNCGETHPACLDFHHRNPKEKKFQLTASQMGNRSWKTIEAEIAKCEVLCSNCHRKLHHTIRRCK